MATSKKTLYQPGDRVGPDAAYTVVSLLGAGGMGEVFEVERDGQRYAYKALQFRHRTTRSSSRSLRPRQRPGARCSIPTWSACTHPGSTPRGAAGGDGPDDLLNGNSPANAGPSGNVGERCAVLQLGASPGEACEVAAP
jgi:hypothetical protein